MPTDAEVHIGILRAFDVPVSRLLPRGCPGPRATAADVHNAWSAWQQELDADRDALLPYDDLPTDVQAEDAPFLRAIQAAARERG